MMPAKRNNAEGYLPQARKRRRRDSRSFELITRLEDVLRNGWLIAGIACIVALSGIAYALNFTPIYESNILIQIKHTAPLSGEFQVDIPAATEVEILRSRAILSRVVSALQLDINVQPKRFPVFGAIVAAKNPEISTPGLFGYGGFVWGADRIRFSEFSVPNELQQRPFALTVTGRNELALSQESTGLAMRLRVGETAKFQTKFGPATILVAEIMAGSGAQFSVSQRPAFQAVEQLQRSLVISEKVKQSNVITVSLQGSSPDLVSRILNEIGREYIRQQVSQRTSEARNQRLFYDRQVAESVKRLEELDAKVNLILRRFGTSDLSEEERILTQRSLALQAKLDDREQKRVELSSRFADLHPDAIALSTIIRDLRRDFSDVEAKRHMIASAQHEILSVNRDKQITSEMNIALVNARHKLDASMLSSNVNTRWVDRAEAPTQPITLGSTTMIAMGCFMGVVLGVIASLLKNFLAGRYNGARDDLGGRSFMLSGDIPGQESDEKLRRQTSHS